MTANLQFQMGVETTQLVSTRYLTSMKLSRFTDPDSQIKAAEDLQMLIRHLQEMWLFGPLNTVGDSQVQQQTDENAKIVGDLLRQLSGKQGAEVTAAADSS